ncbi:MAG: hypothetical protein JSV81_14185 [Anaerolineales bacterium]|nr:MAG: hypothetical protein JSV81_14185 [Anaerolineales bacterium]
MDEDQSPRQVYCILIKSHLDHDWAEWFDHLTITHLEDGTTTLEGPIADQPALHGLLIKIRNLGLPLLSVNRVEP